jgi:murein DD-endopeptidase MepM/ murein hydrolase activator NlpD
MRPRCDLQPNWQYGQWRKRSTRIINDRPSDTIASGRPQGVIVCIALVAALALGVSTAAAVDVPPPPTADAIAPGAAPVPTVTVAPAAPAASVAPAATLLGTRVLRAGMSGADVKQLQRILRKRGFTVTVDGAFGPGTRKAVKALQRRFKLRVTGVVNAAFFKRLGIAFRGQASGTSAAAPKVKGTYPLAGPNAAKAKYLKVFPVAGKHTYTNDFGAPRHQGAHEGNDIMAARGVPVRAVAAGTIKRLTRVETGLGGIWIWLRDTKGNEYYYAHLSSIVAGLDAGSVVTAGQVIGAVGNTGDARYGATHLHFELHPGGGAAANPYTDLRAVDPEPPAL